MNIFTSLKKYPDGKNKTQIENFTTESLVFLLHYSIENRTELAYRVLDYLGIKYAENITISTQEYFILGNRKLIPDITIRINNILFYIIEVKVDSKFNRYKFNRKNIDQVELYSFIPNVNIITLTKGLRSISNVNHESRYWYGIYNVLTSYITNNVVEKYLVDQYAKYLMENNMGSCKVSGKNICIGDVGNLIDQSMLAIKEKYNSDSINNIKYFFEPDNESIGAYFKHKTKSGFCCMYYSELNKLFITMDDSKDENEYSIALESDYFDSDILGQIKYIKEKLV